MVSKYGFAMVKFTENVIFLLTQVLLQMLLQIMVDAMKAVVVVATDVVTDALVETVKIKVNNLSQNT